MSPDRERTGQPQPPRPPEAFRQLLQVANRSFGLRLAEPILARLGDYLAELDSWRRKVNLTGRLTPEDLANHALESALGSELIAHGARVVDIGSGAGFPGLPIAIAREDVDLTLVEPRSKRCAFLRHVVRTIGQTNVQVAEARIEDFAGDPFDVATTRALGRFEPRPHYLKPGGLLLAWTTRSEEHSPIGWSPVDELAIPGSRERIVRVLRGL